MLRTLAILFIFTWTCLGGDEPPLGIFSPASDYPACDRMFKTLGTDEKRTPIMFGVTTVESLDKQPGPHGGERLRLRREGTTWYSLKGNFPDAPQGNPLWMIEVLGESTARFLGYEKISEDEMWVPLPSELNAAIEKINGVGSEPVIGASFYLGSAERSPREEYLGGFVERGALPVSPEGITTVHDLSYHTGIIFYPKEMMNLAKRQAKLALELNTFLRAQKLSETDRANSNAILEAILSVKSSQLDAGTGNLMSALAHNGDMHTLGNNANMIMSDGQSPIAFLMDRFYNRGSYKPAPRATPAVEEAFQTFLTQARKEAANEEGLPQCIGPTCATISANIAEIKRRVAILQSKE